MSNSKREQAERTRRLLIDTARPMFARKGFEGVPAEDLVAAARVTRGALYHHFDGKEGLFEAVLRDAMQDIQRRVGRAAKGARSPREALQAGVIAFLDACADDELRQIVLSDGPAVLGWKKWREMDLEHGVGMLRDGLRQAGVDEPETAAHLLSGALVDAAMLLAHAGSPRVERRRVEAALLGILEGLGVRR
jgi:AcrR family transcriptional regulator